MRQYTMGRLYIEDKRDEDYPVSPLLSQTQNIKQTQANWWDDGWWGNQGLDPHCVAFAWTHWVNDGPRIHSIFKSRRPAIDTTELYCEAQKNDPWPGDCQTPLYDGTTVRAGAKVLKSWGYIEEYRWTSNIEEVVQVLLYQGPVIAGTMWYNDMFTPDREGIIKPTGGMSGGHAYVLNGVDTETGLIRIKNSWGRFWGQEGRAYISIEDMGKLIKNFGEACVPLQKALKKEGESE
jgi:hypothetical protein